MLVFRKIWLVLFSWNTGFEIRSFALLPTYNLIKELSNGGGSFIFNTFRPFTKIFYTDDYMLETINFMKATYVDTSLLHYLSFNGDIMKFTWYFLNFSLLLTLSYFLINSAVTPLILFQKHLFNVLRHLATSKNPKICLHKQKKILQITKFENTILFFWKFLLKKESFWPSL